MRLLLSLVLLTPLILAGEQKISEEPHKHVCPEEHHEKIGSSAVAANTDFALKLFRHVTSKSSQVKDAPAKNMVISPLGISAAFSMLALGARSSTRQEIWEALSVDPTGCQEREFHRSLCHLIQALNNPTGDLQVRIGNAVFVDHKLKLQKSFEDEMQSYYKAEVSRTDFTQPTEAVKQINDFVKNKTEGRIEEAIKGLDPDNLLVLLNHIFFKGEWEKTFSPDQTRIRRFRVDGATEVDVPMMHRIAVFPTLFDPELPCTVVELPYKGNASMIIAVAEQGKMEELERALTPHTLHRWSTAMTKRFIDLSLPKFSIKSTFNLKDLLSDLGIKTAFSHSADFSGITQEAKLKVSKAVHRAVMEVDERGTVAAAATVIHLVPFSRFPIVEVNRPFVALIRDHGSGSIVFMATVRNPLLR